MHIDIKINRKSGTPVYQQICEAIRNMVIEGKLRPGDKIPPERDMAVELKIARGTIKKAYEMLEKQNIASSNQGLGTFIRDIPVRERDSRITLATDSIERALVEMEDLRLSYFEIRNLVDLKIMEHEERQEQFFIAIVDCNPESLDNFEKQLKLITRVRIFKFLIDDIAASTDAARKMGNFDLIITTSTHHEQVRKLIPGLKDKLIQAYVAPTSESIIEMASIKNIMSIGIICESDKFLQIIRNKLLEFGITKTNISCVFISELTDPRSFLKGKDVLIIPPNFSLQSDRANLPVFQQFMEGGGRVITFRYEIEKGSLSHIEERMNWLMKSKKSN